jgi:hypothetical protein
MDSSPGTWLADLCAREGLPFVLGHALYLKAIHGGQATNDQIDAQQIAVLLRGGMRPPASVDPAAMRATRDLLRRRRSLMRKRAALLPHVQQTNSQDNLPEIGQKLASKANRDGVAERVPDPAVQKRLAVDLALIADDDRLLTNLELALVQTANAHDAQTFSRWRSIPRVGTILALVRLYERHAIPRCPRGQEFVSYGRRVKWAKESAGKRDGPSGQKLGQASRPWAFSEAAGLCLRNNPAGQRSLARLEKRHGKGKALTVLAHQLARAVSDLLKRDPAFALDKCCNGYWSGAGEPAASRAADGISLASEGW